MYQLAAGIIIPDNKYSEMQQLRTMVYNHFWSGRLAMELECSTLDFTEQLNFKLWPWLGLEVGSHLLRVGSSLKVAAILGQLRQGCARAGRGKRNPERFLKA